MEEHGTTEVRDFQCREITSPPAYPTGTAAVQDFDINRVLVGASRLVPEKYLFSDECQQSF